MIEIQVLGIRNINAVKEATGELIAGTQLWCSTVCADDSWVDGIEVFKCWGAAGTDREKVYKSLKVGENYYADTDRKGRIISVEV